MRKLIAILILTTFYQTTSLAGQYSDKFANCLMQKTSERDKVVLVRWAFSAMAHHSALKEEFNIPKSKFTKHEIAVADYVQYILGTVCFKDRERRWYSCGPHPRAKYLGMFKTEEEAEKVARNPKALADIVYGNRGGNNGQGYAWRGRGFLQLTHRDNYRAFSSDMRIPDVMDNPVLVSTAYAMDSAIWYFKRNNLWKICDEGVTDAVIKKITKRVNGGYNGLDHRVKETKKIYEWLK